MIYTEENTSAIGRPAKVLLDGTEQKNCFFADTDNGIIRNYKKPLTIKGDELETEELSGNVEVIFI